MTAEERAELERAIAWAEHWRDYYANEMKHEHVPEVIKGTWKYFAGNYNALVTAARERLAMEGASWIITLGADQPAHVFASIEGMEAFEKSISGGGVDPQEITGIIYHPATERGEGEG